MLIGLMGKSGSGKSLISMLLKDLDSKIQIVDVDKIGHKSHCDPEVREKLRKYFRPEIFNEDGTVNRAKLGNIVFSDYTKMQLLYDATYEYMVSQIDEIIKRAEITVLDYALLPLTKYYELCDIKILVEAPTDVRKCRAVKRDGISDEKYAIRDKNSLDYSAYSFDYIIQNDSDMTNLRKMVGEIYEKSIVPR